MSTTLQHTLGEESALVDSELSEGWTSALMGDIADVTGGGTPKASESANFSDQGHPWLTPADLSGFEDIYVQRGRRGLTTRGLRSCSASVMPTGAVLMSSRAPIGYLAVAANPISTNQGFKSFICARGIVPEYCYFWLIYKRPDLEQMGSGSTFLEISGSRAKEIPIDLAPTTEQLRIVEKIRPVFQLVKRPRERLDRSRQILEHLRRAVLAAACSGKLTEDWRQQTRVTETSNELLARILKQRKLILTAERSQKYREPLRPSGCEDDSPKTWSHATMDQLTSVVTSGSRGWARFYSHAGPLFIRAENINSDYLDTSNIAHVHPPEGAEGTRTRVQSSDLLITITGANVTKSALVDREIGEAYVSQHIGLVRPVEAKTAAYLYLWTVSPIHGRRKLIEDAYGAGKPGLNLDNIREMNVALPPLEEQEEIVRRVEALFRVADKIESRVAAASLRAERLTQAVLAKAFRGELVPTEAELARREGRTYEPASALLERIKAERATASQNGTRTKTKKTKK